ncbi:MAG: PEP-CTERM sorting domain-containing protein [Terriglobales bacterium]
MSRYLVLLLLLALPLALTSRLSADTITNYTVLAPYVSSSSFVYDSTTAEFTQASLTWDGLDFNFLSTINDPAITPGLVPCLDGLSGGAATLAYMTTCSGQVPGGAAQAWVNEIPLTNSQQETMSIGFSWTAMPTVISNVSATMDGGTLTQPLTYLIGDDDGGVSMGFSLVDPPVPTPEPATAWLLLAGLALLAGVAKLRRAA